MGSTGQLWDRLLELAPARRPKPPSTLYDIIIDSQDLETVKRYVDGGHELSQQFAGGHSVCLAVTNGDLAFVRYFVDNVDDLESVHDVLENAVQRLSESGEEEQDVANAVFEYLLGQPFAKKQLDSAFVAAAMRDQYTAAKAILAAGLENKEIRTGPHQSVRLSEHLDRLGKTEYAALLTGGSVDEERLLQKERKERRTNAKLKGILAGAEPFGQQHIPEGAAFEERYRALLEEIDAGRWHAELASRDPRFGQSVAEFAAANGLLEILERALEVADRPGPENDGGKLAAAVAAATHGNISALKVLAARGVPVETTPDGRNSPLSEACRYGHVAVVRYLLERGADPQSKDGSGMELTLVDIAGGPRRNEIVAAIAE